MLIIFVYSGFMNRKLFEIKTLMINFTFDHDSRNYIYLFKLMHFKQRLYYFEKMHPVKT